MPRLRELHRDHRRLCGEPRLQPFHQRSVARDLVIAGDRAVDDAEGIHHLLRRQAESAPRGRRRAEITEQRRVDEAAFDDVDLDGDTEPAGHFETGRDRRNQIGARQLAAQLPCRDRGGNGRDARMEDRGVVRVVVVARMGHPAIDPGGVMRGKFSAEHEHVGLRRAGPLLDEARHDVDRLGGRSRQRTRQRISDVGLYGLDDRRVESRDIDGRGKARDIVHDIGGCGWCVIGGCGG